MHKFNKDISLSRIMSRLIASWAISQARSATCYFWDNNELVNQINNILPEWAHVRRARIIAVLVRGSWIVIAWQYLSYSAATSSTRDSLAKYPKINASVFSSIIWSYVGCSPFKVSSLTSTSLTFASRPLKAYLTSSHHVILHAPKKLLGIRSYQRVERCCIGYTTIPLQQLKIINDFVWDSFKMGHDAVVHFYCRASYFK